MICTGEFTKDALMNEGEEVYSPYYLASRTDEKPPEMQLGKNSSVYTFTESFGKLARKLRGITGANTSDLITIDGGPHTLWW